jgi:hypothetical protein
MRATLPFMKVIFLTTRPIQITKTESKSTAIINCHNYCDRLQRLQPGHLLQCCADQRSNKVSYNSCDRLQRLQPGHLLQCCTDQRSKQSKLQQLRSVATAATSCNCCNAAQIKGQNKVKWIKMTTFTRRDSQKTSIQPGNKN